MTKRLIIIGGGVAGLSAGCYGLMNGYQTLVLEKGARAGGLCTSWKRAGYTFDGCLRWLMGTVPGTRNHQLWRELGVIERCEMIRLAEHVRIISSAGDTVVISRKLDELAAHLSEHSPFDEPLIEEMAEHVRSLARLSFPLQTPREFVSSGRFVGDFRPLIPLIRSLRDSPDRSLADFARRFQNPVLRETLAEMFDVADFSLHGAYLVLAGFERGDGQLPLGGSSALTDTLLRRYRELGGEIRFRADVEEVLVEQGHAIGVRLRDTEEIRGDVVVSAADGRTTLFEMLGGRYFTQEYRRWYSSMPIFPSLIQVSFGFARDLGAEPPMIRFLIDPPLSLAGDDVRILTFKHYCYDPSMAPAGHSAVTVIFNASYERWLKLSADREAYADEKKRVAEGVLEFLDDRLGGLSPAVEVVDVATPVTFERFTGNWQGCPEGWALTHEVMEMLYRGTGAPRYLPGLRDFYMVGHWVEPGGGVPAAALSGREVVQLVCREDRRAFQTMEP